VLGLEGEAEHGDRFPRDAAERVHRVLARHLRLARFVDRHPTVSTMRAGAPASWDVRRSATVSFGKHEPSVARTRMKEFGADAAGRVRCRRATSCTSPPSLSHRSAIS